jgi:endonuclease YncB( thermonuclease family)
VLVEWHKRDRYGRLVGKVYADSLDVNLEQVQRGLAWHYVEYAHEQPPTDRASYSVTEFAARSGRRGLWSETRPIPPWEWRRARR